MARRLVVGTALLASLALAASAQADTFGPTVNENTGSAPNYMPGPTPPFAVPAGHYQIVAATPNAYGAAAARVAREYVPRFIVSHARAYIGQNGAIADGSALVTGVDQGSNVQIASVTPLGALSHGFNRIPVSGVILEPGQFIGLAVRSNAGSTMEIGGFNTPGTSSFAIFDYPGTTGTFAKSGTINNFTLALQVEGAPEGQTGGGGGSGNSFEFATTKKLDVSDLELLVRVVTGDTERAKVRCSVTWSQPSGHKTAEFETKPETVELPNGETKVHLKWKHNASTVKRLTKILEESAKARKQKAVITADVTFPDASQQTFTDKAKLKP